LKGEARFHELFFCELQHVEKISRCAKQSNRGINRKLIRNRSSLTRHKHRNPLFYKLVSVNWLHCESFPLAPAVLSPGSSLRGRTINRKLYSRIASRDEIVLRERCAPTPEATRLNPMKL
jgi:hypothetical protein